MKDKFLHGAFILALAGLATKVLGSINRILLSRLLGGEGIGLYQMAYPVYLLLLAVCSAGVPIAVSIIVAEQVAKDDYAGARRSFKVTLGMMACFGIFFAASLYWLAGFLVTSGFLRDARAYIALVVLTPAVFFASILASFRGYFQGYQMMTPPAVSQVCEQFVRVCAMLALAWTLLPRGLEYAAAGAAFAALPGSLTGLAVLCWFYRRASREWNKKIAEQGRTAGTSTASIARRLIVLAVPVSCANIMVPIGSSLDMLIIPNSLGAAGFDVHQATTMFGYLSGMAQPLLMMATIPAMSLAASLVPAASELVTLGRLKESGERIAGGVKICLFITLPAAFGIWTLAQPIAQNIYGAPQAAKVIAATSPSVALLALFQVTTGALQGIGRAAVPMAVMALGLAVKATLLYAFTGVPEWNILGASWATNLHFVVVAALNIFFLCRAGIYFPVRACLRLMILSALMAAAARGTYALLLPAGGSVVAMLASVAVGAAAYAWLVLLTGALTQEELAGLPIVGKKLGKKKDKTAN